MFFTGSGGFIGFDVELMAGPLRVTGFGGAGGLNFGILRPEIFSSSRAKKCICSRVI